MGEAQVGGLKRFAVRKTGGVGVCVGGRGGGERCRVARGVVKRLHLEDLDIFTSLSH